MSEATLMIKHMVSQSCCSATAERWDGSGSGGNVTGETFNPVQDSSTKSLATGTWHCGSTAALHAV